MTQKSFRKRVQFIWVDARTAGFQAPLLLLAVAFVPPAYGAPFPTKTEANVPVEITFTARHKHADPFNEVTVDVVFTDPTGSVLRVPSFWTGGRTWKGRYRSPITGTHRRRTQC